VQDVALEALGWDEQWAATAADGAGDPVRVVRHDGVAVLVAGVGGERHVPVHASNPALAVGDWLLVDGDTVVEVLERRSLLRRRDPAGGDQLVAANVDVVGVVCGLDRPLKAGRIERFAVQTWDAGATPLVVLGKRDLVDDVREAEATAFAAAPGADVAVVSALSGDGVAELRSLLEGRTVVFVGESGAGKSTLVNALAGEEVAATGAVRAGDRKGRHTTTARQLHVLPGPVWLIDSPGLREVGLWAGVDAVDDAFDDIAAISTGCRFRDCSHDTEPGCAVRAAAETGVLEAARLASWRALRKEAAAAELRADPVARRRAGKRFGKMVKEVKEIKRR